MVAVKAAARMPCEPAVQLCFEAIKGPNPDIVRAVGIEGLVRLGAPKERFREFSGLLGSADSVKLASNLILALAGAERDAVNRALKAMLASPNELSRAEAAYCLGYLDDPAALKLLRKLIDKDRSDIVRGQALLGLFHHRGNREGRDAILELLSHESAEVRVLVARMLRAREFASDAGAANAAACLQAETVPEVRTSLLKLLAPLTPDQARGAILDELESTEPEALAGALDALALLGDRGLASKAAESLKSGEARVRARAAHTLWALGDVRGASALRELLSDSYYESFQHGCRALEELLCELTVLDRRDSRKPVLQLLREHMKSSEYAAHARADGGGILAQQSLVTERTEDFDYASARGQWLFKEPAQEGQAMLERLDRMFDSGEAGLPGPAARASEFESFTLMQTDGIGDLAGPGASEADRNNIRSLYRQAVAGDSEAETRLREFTRHADPKMREAAQKLLGRLQTDRAPAQGNSASGVVASVPVEDAYSPGIEGLLKEAVRLEASDLHLSVGYPPIFRINGLMERSRFPVLNASNTRFLIRQLLSPERFAAFDLAKDFDFSYSLPSVGSFRANAFHEFHGCGVVLRVVPSRIPTFEELGTPPILRSLCKEERGLVLVTGPTGSGKSTTMAAMLSYINENRSCHVITIEDPIEFVHVPLSAKFVQREVPTHASSFARALRAALREDPDVIMVGELRDLETMELAIAAAETGHLVLSTLHTINAALTVDRMINVFPPEQQEQMRRSVSEALLAVVSQALLPRQDRPGRIAAYELLCRNPAISNLIRENKLHQIPNVMVGCKKEGMVLLDDWLLELVGKGIISWETGLARAVMKKEFAERFAARKGR
jgi:twitching motility protein PilT